MAWTLSLSPYSRGDGSRKTKKFLPARILNTPSEPTSAPSNTRRENVFLPVLCSLPAYSNTDTTLSCLGSIFASSLFLQPSSRLPTRSLTRDRIFVSSNQFRILRTSQYLTVPSCFPLLSQPLPPRCLDSTFPSTC